ncbi:hypothetical protein FRC02_007240 [Tulasnella sp. 418]|nr:hypothetical protein FRC02_007240 [Tulasnella sp. 418]
MRDLPQELQMGWEIPLEIMLDIPHLRKYHKVILLKDWLKIHGLDPAIEIGRSGDWWPKLYSKTDPPTPIHMIPNNEYDPKGIVRVNDMSNLSHVSTDISSTIHLTLKNTLGDRLVLDWEEAKKVLNISVDVADEGFENMLAQHGWATTYTFHETVSTLCRALYCLTHPPLDSGNLEFAKTITEPIRQVAPIDRVRGFVDDYANITNKILYLQGEVHFPRKPGSMRFTTPSGRDTLIEIVHSIRSPDRIRKLAEKIHERMMEKVGGRMWMAAHMRRGDFV